MTLKRLIFKSYDELIKHIKSHNPSFYYSSQTSTVIPYDKLEEIYKDEDFTMVDLTSLPSSLSLDDNNNLIVKGPVSWKEAKAYLRQHKRNIMTSPTEDLALICAGAATSATGERCFMFGNLRGQIEEITYLDFNGEYQKLSAHKKLETSTAHKKYDLVAQKYQGFKNAPFPRFENETDLMIGTEGQLGVITEMKLKTVDDFNVNHLFMLLPKWENNLAPHLEVLKKVQNFRESVVLCELIDANSFNYLPKDERPNQEKDAIFFEIKSESFESFYEEFLSQLSFLNEEEVFELSENKFHQLRASIPRAVFEENSRKGVTKMGTDVQVKIDDFERLMQVYLRFTEIGVDYNLFGHFGDAHLHFNFMPLPDQTSLCQEEFLKLYQEVVKLNGSPFAEHGIGIIKQKFIKNFWQSEIYTFFKELKGKHDPHNQFFPQGFMSLNE